MEIIVAEDGSRQIEIEITPECFLALRLKTLQRSRIKRPVILAQKAYNDSIKLSDWDNPTYTAHTST